MGKHFKLNRFSSRDVYSHARCSGLSKRTPQHFGANGRPTDSVLHKLPEERNPHLRRKRAEQETLACGGPGRKATSCLLRQAPAGSHALAGGGRSDNSHATTPSASRLR